jgi:hypothetical protein
MTGVWACAGGLARRNGDWPGIAGGAATIVDGRAGIAGGIRPGIAGTGRPVIWGLIAPADCGLNAELVLPVYCGETVVAGEGEVGEWRVEPVWMGRPAAESTRNNGTEDGKTGIGGGLPMLPWIKYIASINSVESSEPRFPRSARFL